MIAAFSTSSTGYAKEAPLLVQSASASSKVFASGVVPAGTGKKTYFEPTWKNKVRFGFSVKFG